MLREVKQASMRSALAVQHAWPRPYPRPRSPQRVTLGSAARPTYATPLSNAERSIAHTPGRNTRRPCYGRDATVPLRGAPAPPRAAWVAESLLTQRVQEEVAHSPRILARRLV